MSDERSEEQPPSVFGNLPASRPGTRSPRRASEARAAPAAEAPEHHPEPEPEPPPGEPEPAAADQAAPRPAGHADDDEPGGEAGGLEDLAWAGVAVAAEAATLGVKLATRAMEALRGAPRN